MYDSEYYIDIFNTMLNKQPKVLKIKPKKSVGISKLRPKKPIRIPKLGPKKRNKYGAVRTVLHGIKFDSKLESTFYIPIKKFCDKHAFKLELQIKYVIYNIAGKDYFYRSDFTIYGKKIEAIVDAKGVFIEKSMSKIQIVKNLYGIPFYVGSNIKECLSQLHKIFDI